MKRMKQKTPQESNPLQMIQIRIVYKFWGGGLAICGIVGLQNSTILGGYTRNNASFSLVFFSECLCNRAESN